jgi:hypothetical protein
MTALALPPRDTQKLAKLCGMFGSDHAGERANAAAAADRLVRERGLTWPIILGVERSATSSDVSIAEMATVIQSHMDELTAKEARFITNISLYLSRGWALSLKQQSWLAAIHARVAREARP